METDISKINIRTGRIINVEDCTLDGKPAFKLYLNFGKEDGIKTSCVDIAFAYDKKHLLDKIVLCCCGKEKEDIKVLITVDKDNHPVLITTGKVVPSNSKIYPLKG